MVSSKRPCVNRKAKKHSQISLHLDMGDADFDPVKTGVIDPVVNEDGKLKWHPINVTRSKKKLKFNMQADAGNRAARKRRLDGGPDGTLTITLINYPMMNQTTDVTVPVDYVIEDQPP